MCTCLHTMCSSTNNLFKFGPIYSSIDYCNAHFTHIVFSVFFLFYGFSEVDKPKTWTRLNQIPLRIRHLYPRWVAYCHDNHTHSFPCTHKKKLSCAKKALFSLIICLFSLPYINRVTLIFFLLFTPYDRSLCMFFFLNTLLLNIRQCCVCMR